MSLERCAALAAACVLVSGCETSRVEEEHGRAVRQMINAQTYDVKTLTNPSAAAVEGADPDMVNAALTVFKENVSRPEEIGKPITIQLGSE